MKNLRRLILASAAIMLLGAGCAKTAAPGAQPSALVPGDTSAPVPAKTPIWKTFKTTSVPASAPAPASAPSKVSVKISNYAFKPVALTVKAGTVVTWTNNDTVPHTVTADDKSFDSGMMGVGLAYSRTFTVAGTFSYFCSLHPSMKGSVTVTK